MKRNLILLNLGTPHSPDANSVGEYLSEFLMDRYIIDLPFLLRWILVKIFIVPGRKKTSSQLYTSIWTAKGSPLRYLSEEFRQKLSEEISEKVLLKMRYSENYEDLKNIKKSVDLVPMYPHYAEATYRSSTDYALSFLDGTSDIRILKPYFSHKPYIDALANSLKNSGNSTVLFSYHGLPLKQIKKVDIYGCCDPAKPDCCLSLGLKNQTCYRAHCEMTTIMVAKAAGLQSYKTVFQSRFGRAKWLTPSTHSELIKMAKMGIKSVVVVAPAFAVDGLETLQEIEDELKAEFLAAGGESFYYVHCLNSDPEWIRAFAKILSQKENWFSKDEYINFVNGRGANLYS